MSDYQALFLFTIQTWQISGFQVESMTQNSAILYRKEKIDHLLHFLLGLFFFGAWWVVWIFLIIFQGKERHQLSITNGTVVSRKL